MKESKFFKFVWRLNGLILMIAGVLTIGVLVFAGYKIITDITRERNTHNIVNVQDEDDIKEKWQLGNMSDIEGGPWIMIPLNSNQSYAQSYYSKSSSSVRNYLFINSLNNEKHWLFNTNDYLIADTELLSENEYGSSERDILAILYKVIKSDSDSDNRLTNKDLQTISISLPNGMGYKEILNGVDNFIGKKIVDKKTLLILFQKEGLGYSANVNLTEFTVSNKTELPKVHP